MRPPVVARDHSPCAGPSQKGVGIGQRGASGCPGGGQRPHQLRFLFHDVRRATLGHHMGAHSKVTHAVDPSPDAASSRAGLALSSDNGRSTAAPERPLAELQLHATGLAPDAEQTPSCTQPDAVVLLKPSDLVTAVQPPQGMLQNENEGQTTRSSSVVSASSLTGQAGTPPSLPSHNPGSAEPARRGNTLSVERSPLCQLSAFPNADSHSGSPKNPLPVGQPIKRKALRKISLGNNVHQLEVEHSETGESKLKQGRCFTFLFLSNADSPLRKKSRR
ncbi:Hypothetical predicted protein [Cloeon dipterum]|uniref:Uncharacterized protein n=1 Tax=Cloeon dipterum TaxID=197152 RepID=A0A8S1DG04_9INSE|nr:Hypothetical predicted protein [Cloeon dipterum]